MPIEDLVTKGDLQRFIRREIGSIESLARQLQAAPRIVGGGRSEIATPQATTSTTATLLGTPDTVTTRIAANGLLLLAYQAIWKNTVASNGRAAVYLDSTKLKIGLPTGGAAGQDAVGPAEVNDDGLLFSDGQGLTGAGGVGAAVEAAFGTPQLIGSNTGFGGFMVIRANVAAGDHDVSVKFWNNAAGTLTVAARHLYVISLDCG